jgi:transcriptional regulator with XRE-family HTH domain
MSRSILHSGHMQELAHATTLRAGRESAGLTREELARLAGTSTSTIARMELNGHIPSGATVARIAAVLGIPADALLSLPTPSPVKSGVAS